ncbi:MAG TPA: Holliday junction resolvase RuvX [Chitinispirillaceae bacterium]|nr:Holliday junction resolvase RuvX [Chitinispirillaceae bacterium]
MKLMGIDYGRRRIGIAISDSDGYSIRGLTTIDRNKKPDAITAILNLIKTEAPDKLIFGLPLDIDNADTVMSKEIRTFAARLSSVSTIPVAFIDESFSSIDAGKLLMFRKKKVRRDKSTVDRLAACIILERYREEQGCAL